MDKFIHNNMDLHKLSYRIYSLYIVLMAWNKTGVPGTSC